MFNIKEIISVDIVDMKTGENVAHFDPADNTELQIPTMSQTCERVEITPEFYEKIIKGESMLDIFLRGDEQIVTDESMKVLKEIRGCHFTDNDGNELLVDLIFYDARIEENGRVSLNYTIVDGEKKLFDMVYR